ncbi:hypothetical protein ACIPSA_03715 [Streptomyces sp. NPDC086549]|uniref:hypothetical protein n=1 Tax=Streptomyces sp. NPDC086549 TaxID=3365752 RepID=UPI00382AC325
MGLFDRLTGTKYPESGVTPRASTEVRAALLALNGPDVPWVVRNATAKEGGDLVAVWEVPELRLTLKTQMRLVSAKHELRTIDEQWRARPGRREYSRGQVTAVWHYGEREFRTADMKGPLRNVVLGAGWIWRGAMFKL